MAEGYNATLEGGQEIYVPKWPVEAALTNMNKAGKILGTENLIRIADINIPAVIVAISESDEPEEVSALITHFLCQARMDGKRITKGNIDELFADDLTLAAEIFAHIIKGQYGKFFISGLAKANSQQR